MELPIATAQMMQSRARPRKVRTPKPQISKANVATNSKFESSKTDRVILSCFEFWAVKIGLGFGNSDLEL
jgi:hypothetical protein